MTLKKLALLAVMSAAGPNGAYAQQIRPTFNESVDEMVGRYNTLMRQVAAKLLLPSAKGLTIGARNERFHVLERKLTSEITVNFEVDNASGRPFSMNLLGYMQEKGKPGPLLAVMSGVGATTLGKGEDAGAVLRACTEAAKAKTGSGELRVRGFTAYCASVQGVWLAGVNVNIK